MTEKSNGNIRKIGSAALMALWTIIVAILSVVFTLASERGHYLEKVDGLVTWRAEVKQTLEKQNDKIEAVRDSVADHGYLLRQINANLKIVKREVAE